MNEAILQSVEQINDTTYTFWFKPSQSIEYTAGQFVELFLPHSADDRGTHRWFTLSSSPSEEMIAITTRKATRPSSFKKFLFELKPGDTVHISQAMGDFVLPMQKSIPIVFLIRGIGITPVRSMLKFLADTEEKRKITVIYSARYGDVMFPELLELRGTQYYQSESNSDAAEPAQQAIRFIKKAPDTRIYVSGPEQFVELAYQQLRENGVKNSRIITDYFHGYEA